MFLFLQVLRCFSSPGSPRPPMDLVNDTPKGWVAPFGHPRIKACSRLPVAFRSVPRPSSPPGAKASTECPSLSAPDSDTSFNAPLTMHRTHPQPSNTPLPSDQKTPRHRKTPRINHPTQTPGANAKNRSAMDHSSLSTQQSPLNTMPRQRTPIPHPATPHKATTQDTNHPVRLAATARPETHQNLIHPDKDISPTTNIATMHTKGDINGITPNPEHPVPGPSNPDLLLLRDPSRPHPLDTNQSLPGGGDPYSTYHPLLAKQVLSASELHPLTELKSATNQSPGPEKSDPNIGGPGRIEPPTPRLSSVCSNQLKLLALRDDRPNVGHINHQSLNRGEGIRWRRRSRQSPEPPPASAGDFSGTIQNPNPRRSSPQTVSLKGGDPAAGSPTATLLRLHPSR